MSKIFFFLIKLVLYRRCATTTFRLFYLYLFYTVKYSYIYLNLSEYILNKLLCLLIVKLVPVQHFLVQNATTDTLQARWTSVRGATGYRLTWEAPGNNFQPLMRCPIKILFNNNNQSYLNPFFIHPRSPYSYLDIIVRFYMLFRWSH